MIRYKNCKVYAGNDKSKKAITTLNIEADGAMYLSPSYVGDANTTSGTQTVVCVTDFKFIPGVHNIYIPEYDAEYRIQSAVATRESEGGWKTKFRWRLTLEG